LKAGIKSTRAYKRK